MDIKELEKADYDIMENVRVALHEVWKKKIIVILVTILGALEALVYVGLVGNATYYTSSAVVFSAAYGSYEESSYYGVSAMNTYAGLIGSSRVCEKAAEQLSDYDVSAEKLKEMVAAGQIYVVGASSSSKEYGYKLTICVSSLSSERVVPITNAMANAFAGELNQLLGESSIQVMDEASSFGSYKAINLILYIGLFAAVGFVLSFVIIFMLCFFSPVVKSVEQCEMNKELIIGIVPVIRSEK